MSDSLHYLFIAQKINPITKFSIIFNFYRNQTIYLGKNIMIILRFTLGVKYEVKLQNAESVFNRKCIYSM